MQLFRILTGMVFKKKSLLRLLFFFAIYFGLILKPQSSYAGAVSPDPTCSNCPPNGWSGANCTSGYGYASCTNGTCNYGCHAVGTPASPGGCSECNGCATANGCGMFDVLSTSVQRNSPTSATVSWVPDASPTSCAGDGGDVLIVGTTNPNALWQTINNNCSGQGAPSSDLTMCGYPDPKDMGTCPPGYTCPTIQTHHLQKGAKGNVKANYTCNYNLAPGCSFIMEANWYYKVGKKDVGNVSQTITGLNPNTVYYFTVLPDEEHNGGQDFCSTVPAKGFVTSCSLDPSTSSIPQGGSVVLTNTVAQNSNITEVTFSGSTSYFSFSPSSTSSTPYQTVVTGIKSSFGAQPVQSDVYLSGYPNSQCTATATVAVNPSKAADPWWQVKDADVESGGDLTSTISSGQNFDLAGSGGFPGVPGYSGSTNLTASNVSITSWLAKNTITNSKVYNYQSLVSQIPTSISSTFNTISAIDNVATDLISSTATHDINNYYWFMYNGSTNGNQAINLPAVNLNGRKVILLVNGADLNITGNVNTEGGFFMVLVGKNGAGTYGNINVNPSVGGGASANLEGIYEADGAFSDGIGSTQLWLRGSLIAYGGVNLQRNLGSTNSTTPAELFEFAPDQTLMYPSVLGTRDLNWKEVAP